MKNRHILTGQREIIDRDTYKKFKGIDGKRLEEIMAVIEKFLDIK